MVAVTVGEGCRAPPPGWIAHNADFAWLVIVLVRPRVERRAPTHGGTFCQGAWWAGPVTCGGRGAGWSGSWLSSQGPGLGPPRGRGPSGSPLGACAPQGAGADEHARARQEARVDGRRVAGVGWARRG